VSTSICSVVPTSNEAAVVVLMRQTGLMGEHVRACSRMSQAEFKRYVTVCRARRQVTLQCQHNKGWNRIHSDAGSKLLLNVGKFLTKPMLCVYIVKTQLYLLVV